MEVLLPAVVAMEVLPAAVAMEVLLKGLLPVAGDTVGLRPVGMADRLLQAASADLRDTGCSLRCNRME